MHEFDRIVGQMKQAHIGNPWTDAPLVALLDDLACEQAAAKPIPNANSIWEVVLHLITTQELIVDLVRSVSRPFQPGDAWPPIGEATVEAWAGVVERFLAGDAEVRSVLSDEFTDERLDEPFREGGTSAYNNLHGYLQHAVYHGGQISMLKKLAA
ncbi:MAG: DinB family protein [Candidatus Bipolaricaulia bacterium]